MPGQNQFAPKKTAVAGRSRWSAWSSKQAQRRAAGTTGVPGVAPKSFEDPNAIAAATANREARTETLEDQRSSADACPTAAGHTNSMAAPVPEHKPAPEPEPEHEHEPAPERNKPQPPLAGRQSGPWDAMAADLAKAAEHDGQSKAAATRRGLEHAPAEGGRTVSHPLLDSSSGSEDEDVDARGTEDSAFLGKVCRGPRSDDIQTQWLCLL